jgi:hypothetical protein
MVTLKRMNDDWVGKDGIQGIALALNHARNYPIDEEWLQLSRDCSESAESYVASFDLLESFHHRLDEAAERGWITEDSSVASARAFVDDLRSRRDAAAEDKG